MGNDSDRDDTMSLFVESEFQLDISYWSALSERYLDELERIRGVPFRRRVLFSDCTRAPYIMTSNKSRVHFQEEDNSFFFSSQD